MTSWALTMTAVEEAAEEEEKQKLLEVMREEEIKVVFNCVMTQ